MSNLPQLTNAADVEGLCVVFDGKYFVVNESVDGVDNDAFNCGVSVFDDNSDPSNITCDVAVVDKYVVVDVDDTDDSCVVVAVSLESVVEASV